MMAAATLTNLVGIPYVPLGRTHAGADCWGVVLLAGRELLDIEYPEYFYSEKDILEHACRQIKHATGGPHWTTVADEHRPGVVHIFRIRGFEVHCGVHIGGGAFLHSLPGRNSCIEYLTDMNWQHRLTGSYLWTP